MAITKSQNNKAEFAQKIEILFLYIKDYKNLESLQLNFTGEGFYHLNSTENKLVLSYRENKKYPKTVFPIKMHVLPPARDREITNITAIIGQNGAGKSNILEYLKRIMTNDLFLNEEALIILKIDGVTTGHHSLQNIVETVEDLDIKLQKATKDFAYTYLFSEKDPDSIYEKLVIPNLESTRVVFYSPQADFQSFPFNNNNPQYNDISTNYLLEFDHGKGEEYTKYEFDKILSHKSQTTKRFIDLIYSQLPLPKDIDNFIPKSTYVQINRLLDPTSKSRNLLPDDEAFLNEFYRKLQEGWNWADSLRKQGNDLEQHKALLVTELSYSIIRHFFHNKETEFGASSGIKIEDIDWNMPLENIVRFFLQNQKWKKSDLPVLLFDSLINAIKESEEFSENAMNSFSFRVDRNIDLITLYSNYINYENLFQETGHPSGMLDFYWRSISSGEKTLLDLFARLLDTKNRNFVNAGATNEPKLTEISNIILLIDEGEMGFHPQWQKNYLKYLISFLRYAYAGFNVQLVLTSHSPFLISDLYRENVIFLKKSGFQSEVCDPRHLNLTFGGNIHEMLNDSFFLEDGIIGAFAQDQIDNIIREIISPERISQERISEIKLIVEAIGEPVVRIKLLNMLAEKKLKDSV